MSSIFRKDDNYVDKPKRNSFDMSFQTNTTLKFGNLIPVLCQPVMPGDSIREKVSFGMRFLPQVFPVQTRQRASLKFYYVRNRNLWKDWMDFIGKTRTGLTPPYLKFTDSSYQELLRPSSLADYLGVPIKVTDTAGSTRGWRLAVPRKQGSVYVPNSSMLLTNTVNDPYAVFSRHNLSVDLMIPDGDNASKSYNLNALYGGIRNVTDDIIPVPSITKHSNQFAYTRYTFPNLRFSLFRKAWVPTFPFSLSFTGTDSTKCYLIVRLNGDTDVLLPIGTGKTINSDEITYTSITDDAVMTDVKGTISHIVGIIMPSDQPNINTFTLKVRANENPQLCWCDLMMSEIPFCSTDKPDGVRISALPFRAIEAIYNALVRNAENNPFLINGVPEYNKYNVSTDGGAVTDVTSIMSMRRCNWADDRFTTALPSPQQGNAPLVGLTGVNGATVVLGNADGSQSYVHLQVDADTGNVVMVDGASGSSNNPALTHAFMSAVDYGITINDLRNVNSFQRWKENNIRRGYKYPDQLMSHYGVSVKYDVLDMPEFIGGVSRDVNVAQITQTVENEYGNLGDYGGQSGIFGEGMSIEHYCDEHGYIIGLLCVYPMPLYQDTLPKHLVYNDTFDYYFPEFSKIGMQPITNKEVAFSLSYCEDKMDDTFGYQRAWYDSLENLDTVNGAFRFDFRNYLIGRDFATMPKLNPDFLTVSSDDLNNTFYSDDEEDKIIGQIYHNLSMKRPLPVVGIPALE